MRLYILFVNTGIIILVEYSSKVYILQYVNFDSSIIEDKINIRLPIFAITLIKNYFVYIGLKMYNDHYVQINDHKIFKRSVKPLLDGRAYYYLDEYLKPTFNWNICYMYIIVFLYWFVISYCLLLTNDIEIIFTE